MTKTEDTMNVTYHFSTTGTLQEVLKPLKRLQEDTVNDKVMPDGRLFQPVKVFEEGDYVTGTRGGKLIKFKATKERMEKWIQNAYRDVPFNFDHEKKTGGNEIGWLRTATGNTTVELDPKSNKYALYVQPEFTQGAYDSFIANGRYRDFSLEIDPEGEYITAIALTNYPKLRTLTQMSELASLDDETQVEISANTVPVTVEVVTDEVTVKEDTPEMIDNNVDVEQVKAEYEAKFSELQAKLQELETAKRKEEEKARKSALVLEMSQKVDQLIASDDGKSVLPAGSRKDALELFCHLADQSEVMLFSDLDEAEQINPIELTIRLLKAQANFSDVMGRTPLKDTLVVPTEEPDERAGVTDALRKIYQNRMKQ